MWIKLSVLSIFGQVLGNLLGYPILVGTHVALLSVLAFWRYLSYQARKEKVSFGWLMMEMLAETPLLGLTVLGTYLIVGGSIFSSLLTYKELYWLLGIGGGILPLCFLVWLNLQCCLAMVAMVHKDLAGSWPYERIAPVFGRVPWTAMLSFLALGIFLAPATVTAEALVAYLFNCQDPIGIALGCLLQVCVQAASGLPVAVLTYLLYVDVAAGTPQAWPFGPPERISRSKGRLAALACHSRG